MACAAVMDRLAGTIWATSVRFRITLTVSPVRMRSRMALVFRARSEALMIRFFIPHTQEMRNDMYIYILFVSSAKKRVPTAFGDRGWRRNDWVPRRD